MSATSQHFPNPPGVNPNDDAVPELLGWACSMVMLSGIAVSLRFVSRYLVRQGPRAKWLFVEDWLALAALIPSWLMCFVAIRGAVHDNFGRHIGSSTPASLRRYLIGLWIFEHAYNFAITLSKLSIIALWWRIFDVKSCHICLIVVGVLEILWLLGTFFTLVFSCVPVRGFWDLDISSNCIDQSQYWIGAAVPNISFDIVLLILPNFWIMKLSITSSQKFALCFVFMLGVLVTICSSLRLWQLILYNSVYSTDLPWVMVSTAIWSMVEGNLSVVCCCLPSMRPLLRLLVHGRLNYGYDYSRNRYADQRAPPMPLGVGSYARPKSVPLKVMPYANILESPTSPNEHDKGWPLASPQAPTFATTVYQTKNPESVPHRPRGDSFSTRAPTRQSLDQAHDVNPTPWLNLEESTAGDSTPTRPVSEGFESERGRASARHDDEGTVRELSHSRTHTAESLDGMQRQHSVASVAAARNPRF